MDDDPFFSVIIPTYNRARVIERAIDSVIRQSFQKFQLIVIDDGSTDDTHKILKNYQNQIEVIRQKNSGVGQARNRAATMAKAPWLCFLDSDDEWLEHKLQRQKELIETYDYVAYHSEELWVRNARRVNPKKRHQKGGGDQFIPSLELCLISPSTVCIEKKIFWQLGGFREDFPVCEDYDLWLKLTSAYEIGFTKQPLIIKYGGHEDQLSRRYKAMDWWRLCSLCWIVKNRSLNSQRLSAITSVFMKKAQILEKGFKKHAQHKRLQELAVLVKEFNSLI